MGHVTQIHNLVAMARSTLPTTGSRRTEYKFNPPKLFPGKKEYKVQILK